MVGATALMSPPPTRLMGPPLTACTPAPPNTTACPGATRLTMPPASVIDAPAPLSIETVPALMRRLHPPTFSHSEVALTWNAPACVTYMFVESIVWFPLALEW